MKLNEQKRAEAAIKLAVARMGGVSATAEKLGVTKGAVSKWELCPPARVHDVAKLSGIPKEDLRPDYYPEPEPNEGDDDAD